MGRSTLTFQLWADAHSSGDEYYRHLTTSLFLGRKFDEVSISLAKKYLAALENLERHLEIQDDSDEVTSMRASTARFIDIIRRDLDRFSLGLDHKVDRDQVDSRDEALAN